MGSEGGSGDLIGSLKQALGRVGGLGARSGPCGWGRFGIRSGCLQQ